MKQIKFLPIALILSLVFFSCTKEHPVETDDVIEVASNSEQAVIAGQPNCSEAISGNIKIKVSVDSTQPTSPSKTIKVRSRTEKVYNSGGFILVYDLSRTTNKISLEYKHVNTPCGNPATGALSPATSSPLINNLASGSYPIEIKVNGVVNKGVLNVPGSTGSATLVMQTTNGIVIE
jgi:hypothetical protein